MKFARALILLAPSACWGISMTDTIPGSSATDTSNPYIALGAGYSAVAYIDIGGSAGAQGSFKGTGTLVMSTDGNFKLLSAAHCFDSDMNGVVDQATFGLYFGSAIDTGDLAGTTTARVFVFGSSVSWNTKWHSASPGGFNLSATGPDDPLEKGAAQYDIAVISFTAAQIFSGALPTPMAVSLENPLGQTVISVGYGNHGLGNSFANSGDATRRAMHNVADVVGYSATSAANTGYTIQADFDSPTDPGKSSLGANTPVPSISGLLEGATAGGDSGGPVLFNGRVTGVLNGGFNPFGNVSEYGDRSIWAAVAEQSNMDFLIASGVAVPEPEETVALIAAGLAGFAWVRRQRRGDRQA
jgi:hypothetical protein